MKKTFYKLEQRWTDTHGYLSEEEFKTLKEAKKTLNDYKELSTESTCIKGQTFTLVKETWLYDEDDNVEVIEEIIEKIEF